jgi:hypothetical protein
MRNSLPACNQPFEAGATKTAVGTALAYAGKGPGKLLMVGVRDFADLRPKIRQIYVLFLRI